MMIQGKQKHYGLMSWGVPALIFIAVLLAYLQVLAGKFAFLMWDDDISIYLNPHIRKLDAESFIWMFTDATYIRRYVPLNWLSFAINYQFGGMNPWGYHAGNVLMHACNAVLLFWLLKRLCEVGFPERAKDMVLVVSAAVGALLWALHPLRVECVAWVTGRVYTQCTLFALISMICYVCAATNSTKILFKSPLYWISVLAFAASLCTHQLAITLVGVLIMLDVYPLRRFGGETRYWSNTRTLKIWLEKVPFLGIGLAIIWMTYWARIHATGVWSPPPTWEEFSLGARIMQLLYIEAHYIWRPWWMVGYSPVYTTLVTDDFFSPLFVISAILVGIITLLTILLRKRFPILLVLWCCHFVLLLPVVGWFEHPHYPSDRYSYLQGMLWSVLLCTLVLWGWPRLKDMRIGWMIQVAGMALLIALGLKTQTQQMIWKDSEQLFKHMIVTLGEDIYRADIYHRLGIYYEQRGRIARRWSESLPNFIEAEESSGAKSE